MTNGQIQQPSGVLRVPKDESMATNFQQSNANAAANAATAHTSLLDSILEKKEAVAARYRPALSIEDSIDRYNQIRKFVAEAMREGEDYGRVPGIEKPFLFQAGAEKLLVLFGYVTHYEPEQIVEDWDGSQHGEPLFYYRYRCIVQRDRHDVGEGIGSANSWEAKYRYRWVPESDLPSKYQDASRRGDLKTRDGAISEFSFAVTKASATGPYGKPKEYWDRWKTAIESGEARQIKRKARSGEELDAWEMGSKLYRVPNPEFGDVINTVQKIAAKRAKIAGTLSATGLSSLFTQDEDSGALAPDDSEPRRAATAATIPAIPEPDKKLPTELQEMRDSLVATHGKSFNKCLEHMEGSLIDRHSQAGADVYNKHLKEFRAKHPKGAAMTLADLWNMLMAMHADLERLDSEKTMNQSAEGWPEVRE